MYANNYHLIKRFITIISIILFSLLNNVEHRKGTNSRNNIRVYALSRTFGISEFDITYNYNTSIAFSPIDINESQTKVFNN